MEHYQAGYMVGGTLKVPSRMIESTRELQVV